MKKTVRPARVVSSLTHIFISCLALSREITRTPSSMFTCNPSQGHVQPIAGPRVSVKGEREAEEEEKEEEEEAQMGNGKEVG